MSSPARSPFVAITVACFFCETKQVIQVAARLGFTQMSDQTVKCIKCSETFSVQVPNTIIAGPFQV